MLLLSDDIATDDGLLRAMRGLADATHAMARASRRPPVPKSFSRHPPSARPFVPGAQRLGQRRDVTGKVSIAPGAHTVRFMGTLAFQ